VALAAEVLLVESGTAEVLGQVTRWDMLKCHEMQAIEEMDGET
jgi:hypothetical protein